MTFTVPGYRIEGLLGQGSQGHVWAARSLVDGDRVALKRLPAGTPAAVRAARSEAALLAALDHPNLIALRGFLVVRTDLVLVLELAGAGSLAGLLARRRRLTPAEVVATVSPVAAALAHAHAAGVLHGDVSAANLLFTEAGRPKLADLGVARLLAAAGPATGTPAYLDPVLAAGGAAGASSDLFALAAVALHALTGAGPWQRAGQPAAAEQLLAVAATGQVVGLADRLAGLPPAVAGVLARTLDPDPHRRGSAAEFALELRAALPPAPVRLGGGLRSAAGRAAGLGQVAGLGRAADAGPAWLAGRRRAVPEGRRAVPVGWRAVPVGRAARVGRRAAPVGRHSAQWAAANRAGSVSGARQCESDDNPARLAADLTRVSITPPRAATPATEAEPRRRFRLASLRCRSVRLPGYPDLVGRRGRISIGAAAVLLVVAGALMLVRLGGNGSSMAAVRRAGAASPVASSSTPSSTSRGGAGSPAGPRSAASSSPASPTGPASPTSRSGAGSPAGSVDPAAVLTRLDRLRSLAYAQRRPELLAQVYRSTTLLAADTAQLLRTVPAGCRLTGLDTDYQQLQASGSAGRLRIRTLASLPAGALACAGTVRGHTRPIGPVRLELTLSDAGSGYLLDDERQVAAGH